MFLRHNQDLVTLQTEMKEYEYSKIIPQFLSCEKRKTVSLFVATGRLKKGKVQVEVLS